MGFGQSTDETRSLCEEEERAAIMAKKVKKPEKKSRKPKSTFLHSGICKTCGVPHPWGKDAEIDSDNTSLLPPMRGVFYETEELEHLLGGLEETVGLSLSNIYITAHKRAVSMFVSPSLQGFTVDMARRLLSRIVYMRIVQLVNWCGLGKVSLRSYKKGKWLELEVSDIWSERLFPGDVAGVWTAVEGKDCSVRLRRAGSSWVCRAEALLEWEDRFTERLHPPAGVLMGTKDYPRCPVCGAPDEFKCYQWDRKKGLIKERDTGISVAHNTVGCVNTALFEIREELGKDLLDIVTRMEAEFIKKRVAEGTYERGRTPGWIGTADRNEVYSHYLDIIKRRCMGNPVKASFMNKTLEVTVRNPGNEELLLGRILGTYEAVEGTPGQIDWRVVQGVLEAKVTPSSVIG